MATTRKNGKTTGEAGTRKAPRKNGTAAKPRSARTATAKKTTKFAPRKTTPRKKKTKRQKRSFRPFILPAFLGILLLFSVAVLAYVIFIRLVVV